MSPKKDIPKRRMPSSSATIHEEAPSQTRGAVSGAGAGSAQGSIGQESSVTKEPSPAKAAVMFSEPTFAAPAKSLAAREEVLSPTETRETREMIESKDRLARVPQL